ncbi:MAG: GvpL/GvpF family gas vesicle protein, partial [Solirubrobacteraceae bacterium]
MSLLLYGIAEARGRTGDRLAGVGLGGRPLRRLDEGPLAAVVSEHPGSERAPAPAASAAREYDRTIQRLMEHEAILPARFGSLLDDEPAVRALLRRRRDDLLPRLGRVRGAVEIGLRTAWRSGADGGSGSTPDSGTAYLKD